MTEDEIKEWYKKIEKKEYLYSFVGKKKSPIKREIKTLENAPKELLENKDFILLALLNNHIQIDEVSPNLLNEKSFILKAINNKYSSVYSIPEKWRKDEDVLLTILKNNSNVLFDLVKIEKYQNLVNKEELAKTLLEINPNVIKEIYFPFRNNKDFIKKAILLKPKLIEKYKKKYTKELFQDEHEVKHLLNKHPESLAYLNIKFRNRKDLALDCVKRNINILNNVGNKLKNDEEFMILFINHGWRLLNNLSKKLLTNDVFMKKVIEKHEYLVKYVDKSIVTDEWLLSILKKTPYIYTQLESQFKEKDIFIAYYLSHKGKVAEISGRDMFDNLPHCVKDIAIMEINNFKLKENINVYDYIEQKYLKILLEYEFKQNKDKVIFKNKKIKI